jgi:hypothetical protein
MAWGVRVFVRRGWGWLSLVGLGEPWWLEGALVAFGARRVRVRGQASRGVLRRGGVFSSGRAGGWGQPGGAGSVARRANALVRSFAQGQLAWMRSVAVRAWNTRRPAT